MPVRTAFFLPRERNMMQPTARDRLIKAPCSKEGRLATQGDSLLHDLIQHEQRQNERVKSAHAEAEAIAAEADTEAGKLLAKAQREAKEAAEATEEAARQEAESITESIVGAARSEAEALHEAASAHRERAVQLVLERVLP